MHCTATHLKIKIAGLLLFGCLLLGSSFFAQTTYTWTGSTSSDWNTASNWNPVGIPSSVDYVIIGSTSNSPSISGNVTVAQFSLSSATLTLNGNTLTTSNSATFNGSTITSGYIQASGNQIDLGNSIFNASISASCVDVFFYGSTFNQPLNLTQTGTDEIFLSGGDNFNAPVQFSLINNSGWVLGYNFQEYFKDNIVFNCLNAGTIVDLENSELSAGKTLTIGNNGFNGTLNLVRFIMLGNNTQTIDLTGNLSLDDSRFYGNMNVTADGIFIFSDIFYDTANFTQTGGIEVLDGLNTFSAPVIITNIGIGPITTSYFGPDTFNSDVTFINNGGGLLTIAVNDATFNGNITINNLKGQLVVAPNSSITNSGTPPNLIYSGASDQTISGTPFNMGGSITLNKYSGNLILNTSVDILNSLNLQNGNLIVNSGNHLLLDSAAQVNGASMTSFVDGAVQKRGKTAFTFPIGRLNDFQPLTIGAPANETDVFTAQYFHSPQLLSNNTDTTIRGLSTCEYWTLSRTAGKDNVAVTLGWNGSSCGVTSDITQMGVAEYNVGTGNWTDEGGINPTGNQTAGVITSALALKSYGTLTLAIEAPLPKPIIYFWNGSTSSDWNTATNWTPKGIPSPIDTVIIGNTQNNPSLSSSVNVAGFSINSAVLTLNGDTLTTTFSASFNGATISGGSIQATGNLIDLGNSIYNASINAVCSDVFFYGSTFNQTVNLIKTGDNSDFMSGGSSFNGDITITETSTGWLGLEYNYDDHFNSNLIVNCTNSDSRFDFGESGIINGTPGYSYLAQGKTISVGSQGFIGILSLSRFIQQGNTSQNLSLTGTGYLSVGGNSIFNGDLNFTAFSLDAEGSIFNGTVNFTSTQTRLFTSIYNVAATFTNTGNENVFGYGGNTFNSDLTINQLGTGQWRESCGLPDTFKGNIIVNVPNNGTVELGGQKGSVIPDSPINRPSFFIGQSDQSISGSPNGLIIANLQLNKPVGNLILNTVIEVSNILNLQSGKIIVSTGNVLKLDPSIQVIGASQNSFIDGLVQETGNTNFTFPIGNGNVYQPLSINGPQNNITNVFSAQYFNKKQILGNILDSTIMNLSSCEYWTFNTIAGSEVIETVTLGWNANSCNVVPAFANMAVAIFDSASGQWKGIGHNATTGNQTAGTVTSNFLSEYGPLTLANSAGLPYGTVYTWNGSTSTDWNTSSNWTPNGVPGKKDTAIITAENPFNFPTLANKTTVAAISVNGTTFIPNGDTLITTYSAIFTGNSVISSGNIQANGNLLNVVSSQFNAGISATCENVIFNSSQFNQAVNVNIAGTSPQFNQALDLLIPGAGELTVFSSTFGGNVNFTTPFINVNGPSTNTAFNGTVIFTSPEIYLFGGSYNAPVTVNSTGNISNPDIGGEGGNVFNSELTINQSGNGLWTDAFNVPDTFKGKVIVNTSNGGRVELGFGNSPSFFTGQSDQTISGSTNNFVIDDLELMKPASNLIINTSVEVSKTLNFQSGNPSGNGSSAKIIMGSGNVLKLDSGVQVLGVSQTNFVDGALQETGSAVFNFPVGNGNDYQPLSISGVQTNNADTYIAQYFGSPQAFGTAPDTGITNISSCEYWTLQKATGSDNVSVSLRWNSNSCNITPNDTNMRVVCFDTIAHIWRNDGELNPKRNLKVGTGTITSSNVLTKYGALTLANHLMNTCSVTANAGVNVSICNGKSTNLIAAGGIFYNWSPSIGLSSDTIASPVANPNATTTYSVTVSTSSTCSQTATVTVTVNPLPIVTSSASVSALCVGQSVVLTGGSSSGPLNYTWTGGVTDGLPYIPTFSNTYTVTGTDANGCTASSTVAVAVNPNPYVTANASAVKVCAGSPLTLTGNSNGTLTYSWANDNVTDGTAFIPGSTSTYTVTGTNSFGCSGTSSVTVTVTPVPIAVAGTATTICANSTVSLTSGSSGGQSYIWFPTTGLNNYLISEPTAKPLTTTTYTVSVSNSGCSSTSSVTITVNPSPTINITVNPAITILPGGNPNTIYVGHGAKSLTLTATINSNATSYQWSGGPGLSCTNCLVTNVNPTVTTDYTLTVTNGNGCVTTSTITIYVVELSSSCVKCN